MFSTSAGTGKTFEFKCDRIHPKQVSTTLMVREILKHCDFDYDNSI